MNTSFSHPSQKYLLIGGVALGAILLVMTIWLSFAGRQTDQQTAGNMPTGVKMAPGGSPLAEDAQQPDQAVVEPQEQPATHTASRVTFDAVSMPQTANVAQQNVTVYRFDTYDADDVDRMAAVLGLTERKVEGGATIAYNTVNPKQQGWLMVDEKNGVLTYRYFGNEAQQTSGTTATARAQSFLNNLGVIDDLVDCSITYQKTSMPDVTMVECHRDWQRTGLPILNFVGLINVPETTPLTAMKMGRVHEGGPDDPSIVNTSTGQEGQSRPSDFNTATVSVHADGTILGFTSNIREISGEQQIAAADMIPVEDVRQKIVRGETEMFFIRPEGNAIVDWNAFFATTTGRGARITDLMLAYVEIPGKQEYLAPMYIARGTAQMGNYKATFIAAHPATKIGISAVTRSGKAVAGLSTSQIAQAPFQSPYQSPFQTPQGDSPKLATFGFVPAATIDGTATGECLPGAQHLYPLIDLPPVGKIGPWSIDNKGQRRHDNWYLIPSTPESLPEINNVVALFDALGIEGKRAELREMDKLEKEWAAYSQCPLRCTGTSPTVFIYGPQGSEMTVKPDASLIYREPAGAWNVTTQADGLLKANGKTVGYLYYEYKPVSFSRPTQGWNVRRSELMTFAQETIAPAIGLSEEEGDRLAYEIVRASFGMTDETVYVAPMTQSEVDARLPLSVTGTENIVRSHFYVGSEQPGTAAPNLTPIARTQTMVLELGAAQGK